MRTTQNRSGNRRDFLGKLAGVTAFLGINNLTLAAPAPQQKATPGDKTDPDQWFTANVKGKHKMVFDATAPKELFTFAWPKVFLMTNSVTGTNEKDCGVVVVLRHEAIPYAMGDDLWAKYKFGEMFKINDPRTSAAATRNPFWETKPDDFKLPGVGAVPLGIRDLQASGVLFCVCSVALTVYSAAAAMHTNADAGAVRQEWMAGLLPSIEPMPSGLWAVGRAQEHGCTYCFAG